MIPLRDANPTRRTPIVTLTLIVACVVVFAYELGLDASSPLALEAFVGDWGLVPADVLGALERGELVSQEMATLLSHQFLHGGLVHLLGNMLYLWIFGNNIEDRLGRLRFVLFYLGGGVLAGLAQIAVDPNSSVPMVGASGAVAATLGGYFVLFPRARITTLVFLGFFYQLINVPAVIVLGFWFVLQLFDGLASLGAETTGGVAFFAHIGGFAAGALAVRILAIGRRGPAGPRPVG